MRDVRTLGLATLSVGLFVALVLIVTSLPRRQAYVRNLKRQQDVTFIGHILEEAKKLSETSLSIVPEKPTPVCGSLVPLVCDGAIVLPSDIVLRKTTSTDWLHDPWGLSVTNTGYVVSANTISSDGFVVQAPLAELGVTIQYPR